MPTILQGQSTTGGPSVYEPYQQIGLGLQSLLIDRLGVSEFDVKVIQAGGAVVGIVFPTEGGELDYPVLVIAVRGGSNDCVTAAGRVSTARYKLTWQTTDARVLSCELYTPGQPVHRQSGEQVFRKFVCMATGSYCGRDRTDGAFVPLQDFRKLVSLELLYGPEGRFGQFGPIVPHVNSGNGLRYLRFTVPLDTVPVSV